MRWLLTIYKIRINPLILTEIFRKEFNLNLTINKDNKCQEFKLLAFVLAAYQYGR